MEQLHEVTVAAQTRGALTAFTQLLPSDLCCNCGASTELSLQTLHAPIADLTGESDILLPTPHCPRCVGTALRLPPRFGRTLRWVRLFLLPSAAAVAGGLYLLGIPFRRVPGTALASILVLAAGLPFYLFRWRKPSLPGQTSRYHAVRIRLRKTFFGDTASITFAFTNPRYADRFRSVLAEHGYGSSQDAKLGAKSVGSDARSDAPVASAATRP